MVNCTEDFVDQPKVMNGFSDLMVAVFGDKGKHARSALACMLYPATLPWGWDYRWNWAVRYWPTGGLHPFVGCVVMAIHAQSLIRRAGLFVVLSTYKTECPQRGIVHHPLLKVLIHGWVNSPCRDGPRQYKHSESTTRCHIANRSIHR